MFNSFPITISTVTTDIPKVEQRGRESMFETPDKARVVSISHRETKALRAIHDVEFRQTFAPDADDPLKKVGVTIKVHIDRDMQGITFANVDELWAGIKAAMTSAVMAKIYGNES